VEQWIRETVQRCKSTYGLCKGAKVRDRDTFPGLRSRLIGYQVRVIRFRYRCGPEPAPEHLSPRPDG
jgi:hypothetical protein